MADYEPTVDEVRFLHELNQHVRSNPHLYRSAGQWLDREYSDEACWRREVEKVDRDNREVSTHHPDYKFELRERRIVEGKFSRLIEAVGDFLQRDSVLITASTWEVSSRVLLLCWLLTDEDAHGFIPRLCEFQEWDWEDDRDEKFSRLWAQIVLPNAVDWQEWLDLCRKAWVTRPDEKKRSLPVRLQLIVDSLEKYALKVGVCLTPDDPKWANNNVAQSVLFNLKCLVSGELPPHIVAGIAVHFEIAHEIDLLLDELPDMAPRWQEDFQYLFCEFSKIAGEFKEGRDDYEESLGKTFVLAMRAEKLAERLRVAAARLPNTPRKNLPTESRGSADSDLPKAQPPKRPSVKDFQVWEARRVTGITNQTELSTYLTERGIPIDQGSISRSLTKVEAFINGGGTPPNFSELANKPTIVDPKAIELGKRTDGRTLRQRDHLHNHRDSDND